MYSICSSIILHLTIQLKTTINFTKIVETAVVNRVLNYIKINKILCNAQRSFRPKHNTNTVLCDGLNFLTNAFDN